MKYTPDILAAHDDPKRLEELYQAAQRDGELGEFTADLLACREQAPDNLLYAAWYYRLRPWPGEEPAVERAPVKWLLAVPLALVTGLIFWGLTRDPLLNPRQEVPFQALIAGPILAAAIIALLTLATRAHLRRGLVVVAALAAACAYVVLLARPLAHEQYGLLMVIHLPLLAWIGVGLVLLGLRSDHQDVFAVMSKSIEVLITSGVFYLAGGLFAAITVGLFSALNVWIPHEIQDFVLTVGGGAVPVVAVAAVYDPHLRPAEQRFEEGLGKLLPTLTRLLLPLAVVVLAIYLVAIPFNFMEPFRSRDVLVIYNVLLFAVMALLIGAAPVRPDGLSGRQQSLLRLGILVVTGLTIVISLYALSATVYRTVLGGPTMNRLTVIGWNVINTALLALLAYRQLRRGRAAWLPALHSVVTLGAAAYIVWDLFLILLLPWLIR